MPKIRSGRWKTTAPAQLPPLFVLPRDTDIVRCFGYSHACECAYTVIRDSAQERIGKYGSQVMAVEACLLFEKQVHEGKVGANDPLLYRKIYIDMFNEVYQTVYMRLVLGELVIDSAWTEAERLSILYIYAAQHLALIPVV